LASRHDVVSCPPLLAVNALCNTERPTDQMSRSWSRMARNPVAGPAKLDHTAAVARRYYVDGKSKIQIAEEFNLSRFRVARLLDVARSSGLVRIEIGYPGAVDLDLSGRLQEAFELKHSIVIDTPDDDQASLRQHLGK